MCFLGGDYKRGYVMETDPNGKLPSEAGAKLDAGKNKLGLMYQGFANALYEVGRVSTYGAEKYSPNGWVKVEDGVERYTDAMLRHFTESCKGEEIDEESGLLHDAQVAWNALARLELKLRENSVKKR